MVEDAADHLHIHRLIVRKLDLDCTLGLEKGAFPEATR